MIHPVMEITSQYVLLKVYHTLNKIEEFNMPCRISIKRERVEFLQSFIDNLKDEKSQIKNVNPTLALHALVTYLAPCSFYDKLARRSFEMLDGFRKMAKKL